MTRDSQWNDTEAFFELRKKKKIPNGYKKKLINWRNLVCVLISIWKTMKVKSKNKINRIDGFGWIKCR